MTTLNPLIEKLGYGPEDRLVIFHADDVGMCHGSNQAFMELSQAGIVKTGSIMVPCPAANEMFQLATEEPTLDLGIHLTLTCEWADYRWGPVSPHEEASALSGSGLTASDGGMWRSREELAEHVVIEAAIGEMEAQIEYARDAGLDFTHIDTHMGTAIHSDLAMTYGRLGLENRVPLLVGRNMDIPGAAEGAAFLEAQGMPLVDWFRITPCYAPDPPDAPSAKAYEAVIRDLPPGVTYFSLHPNAPDDIEAIAGPDVAQWRIFESENIQSERAHDFLQQEGIIPLGYREIRAVMRSE